MQIMRSLSSAQLLSSATRSVLNIQSSVMRRAPAGVNYAGTHPANGFYAETSAQETSGLQRGFVKKVEG